jgi:hypothetical protein
MKTGYQNSRFAHQVLYYFTCKRIYGQSCLAVNSNVLLLLVHRSRDLRAYTAAKLQTLVYILPTSITAQAKITCPMSLMCLACRN